MADIAFTIPRDKAELLSEISSNYTVKNVIIPAEITQKLEEARTCLQDDGPNFILDNFDTYYSVLHHADTLPMDVVFKAYHNLDKATNLLDNAIGFLLDDKDSLNDELKAKMVNVLKMLLYIYTQFVIYLEQKKRRTQEDLVVRAKNKAKKDDNFAVNKSKVLDILNRIIQREINLFWDPPVVEHDFIGLFAETCFSFLQNPAIKQDKELRMEVFGVFGNLIKSYDYGKTFVARLIQSIRMYEHVVHCVPEGIKMVVEQFSCRGLVHYFVKEATEWQVDETFQDVQGTRCCSIFLTELAVLIPDLMIPEVMYLNQYLSYESQPLRTSILNVITEVILKVLTKHDLSEEEKESRDEFLDVLIEHTRDYSALVRSKVIQNLTRLQKQNAIPLNYQNNVLKRVTEHLYDKAGAVRKSAINCITTFLEHNPFGANLQLTRIKEELLKKTELLNKMEVTYKQAQVTKIEELQAEWAAIEEDVRKVIKEQLEATNDDEEPEETTQPELNKDQIVEIIKAQLQDKKIVEAFKFLRLLKSSIEEWNDMKKLDDQNEVNLYLVILRSFFLNAEKITDELRTGAGMTSEDIQKIETLENVIKFLNNSVSFLTIIDSAIQPLKRLLFTQTISDMHEAIHFFITAYQFQIDNASEGVLGMLKLMQYSEPDRKEAVVEAFKTIYLTTDTRNLAEHTTTILKRLIALLKEITYEDVEDFQHIVSEWTSKGILDNSVIDKCWQYFTKRESVSDEDSRTAAELLRMAAMGRNTIITKNINVVTTMAFSNQYRDDMRFLANCCRLMAVADAEKIDIQSKDAPFKIIHIDPIFQTLPNILIEKFFEDVPYYSEAMDAGINFIFRVCAKPTAICERIIKEIHEKLQGTQKTTWLMIRFCELLGCLAIKLLSFLDNTVYRELKRRSYLREARKENAKDAKNKYNKNKNKSRRSKGFSNNTTINDSVNDSVLVGADAEDTDAEFILNLLENYIVSECGLIGKYYSFLTQICQRPDLYDDQMLQHAATLTLMRYMLVSGKFCRDNIRLLFTIFEKTTNSDIRCSILIHCSDLLTRFPNIVEPWSPRIYARLKDPLVKVRKTAFFSLSNLILRDMIRAHSHISEMAACMIDENQEVVQMCHTLFGKLAQKDNNLANVIPDIFSHLVKVDDINQDNLRRIMKFLFELIDKSKRMENLVDRFCCKYSVNEDFKLNRNITYCLSLINYNDKALRKLHEKFPMYKHHVHDAEIYSTFKQILGECSKTKVGKTDLKPIVTEIENCIASVFEIDEDGQPARPPPVVKKTKSRPARKKSAKKQTYVGDSDDESDEDPSSKKRKPKRGRARKSRSESDSE